MNSGVNFRRAASIAVREIFSSSFESTSVTRVANPIPPSTSPVISPAPKFDVMMMMHCDRSTRRLSPKVSVALSRMPSSSCQSESLAFSISSNSRIESFSLSVCHWFNASWVSNG